MDEDDIGYADLGISLIGIHPAHVAHVSAVLARVSAGLAMEGYPTCLHMSPSEQTLPMTEYFTSDGEGSGDV